MMKIRQPPSVQSADPAMWVKSRQFTVRIVTASNAQIFEEPVVNDTRDFPYIWEEIVIPITDQADRTRVESIMLAAAAEHAVNADSIGAEAKKSLQDRFGVAPIDLMPRSSSASLATGSN